MKCSDSSYEQTAMSFPKKKKPQGNTVTRSLDKLLKKLFLADVISWNYFVVIDFSAPNDTPLFPF
jgi:hypothetical protein